jgi:hypothetical protein
MVSVSKQRNCEDVYNNRCFPWCLCRILIREVNAVTELQCPQELGPFWRGRIPPPWRKGKSQIRDSKIRSRVPRNSGPRKTALARPAAYTKDRPVLSSERAAHKSKTVLSNSNEYLVMSLDTKTYWLTDRQSQCDFDLTELVQGQLRVSRKLEEWVQKIFSSEVPGWLKTI